MEKRSLQSIVFQIIENKRVLCYNKKSQQMRKRGRDKTVKSLFTGSQKKRQWRTESVIKAGGDMNNMARL